MKAAQLFVKALENEGVEFIFGIPGEENIGKRRPTQTLPRCERVPRHPALAFLVMPDTRKTPHIEG
jgi:hypothetical protein